MDGDGEEGYDVSDGAELCIGNLTSVSLWIWMMIPRLTCWI